MRALRTVIVCALALATTIAGVGVTPAAVKVNSAALRDAVTVDGIRDHLQAFQAIADANGGTRAAGTPGYDASVEYVAATLDAAGYEVAIQEFSYDRFVENSPPVFERLSPAPETYTEGFEEDFLTMEYSGSADIDEAPLQAAGGIVIPSPGGSTSGCAAGDFSGFEAGNIALIQRGTCPFRQKAQNALDAEAAGVVIFNEGNEDPSDDRVGVVNGTLDPPLFDIPVIGTSHAVGKELYNRLQNGQVVVRLAVDAGVVTTDTMNVIADTTTGREDRTVVVGAHLDSVPEGPGINDNGSGSAVILEMAEAMAELGIKPRNQVRFAFWGAEESGLIGSEFYVANLGKRDRKNIAVNLNFDMLGSTNYVRFVYDGDGSDTADSGPVGSGVVEDVFVDYFSSADLETEPTAFDGRSDYGPFIAAGIPAGGLFSGAEGIKTPREENIYGGQAGEPYDPCYHQACDDIENVRNKALNELADGAAHATLAFAETTSAVSGTDQGEGKPKKPRYKGPLALR